MYCVKWPVLQHMMEEYDVEDNDGNDNVDNGE